MNSNNPVTEQQRQTWNEFSGGWQKWDEHVIDFLKPIGDRLLDKLDLQPTDTLLDVSTGTGEPGLTATSRVSKVVATDVAEDMVEIARVKAEARGITNFEVKVADAEALPFEDDSFDAITCRLGVMYFGDPAAGVKEITRVLKPGRKVAYAAWSEPAKNPWAATAAGVINQLLELPPPPPDAPGIFRHSQPGVLLNLLARAGLKALEEEEVTGKTEYDSPEQYWELMTDVAAPIATSLAKVDETTREQAKAAVCQAAENFERGGKIVFPWACHVVWGSK